MGRRLARLTGSARQARNHSALRGPAANRTPVAAVVVDARYSALFKLEHVGGPGWSAPWSACRSATEVHVVFAGSRRFAGEWTYRFLSAALADAASPVPQQ